MRRQHSQQVSGFVTGLSDPGILETRTIAARMPEEARRESCIYRFACLVSGGLRRPDHLHAH